MKFKFCIILLFIIILSVSITLKACTFFGTTKYFKARSSIFCDNVPYQGAKVELVEVDKVTANDLLNTTFTDTDGYFKVSGACKQFQKVEPEVVISHACGIKSRNCYLLLRYRIPAHYITKGKPAKRWFNINNGNIKLNSKNTRFYEKICNSYG